MGVEDEKWNHSGVISEAAAAAANSAAALAAAVLEGAADQEARAHRSAQAESTDGALTDMARERREELEREVESLVSALHECEAEVAALAARHAPCDGIIAALRAELDQLRRQRADKEEGQEEEEERDHGHDSSIIAGTSSSTSSLHGHAAADNHDCWNHPDESSPTPRVLPSPAPRTTPPPSHLLEEADRHGQDGFVDEVTPSGGALRGDVRAGGMLRSLGAVASPVHSPNDDAAWTSASPGARVRAAPAALVRASPGAVASASQAALGSSLPCFIVPVTWFIVAVPSLLPSPPSPILPVPLPRASHLLFRLVTEALRELGCQPQTLPARQRRHTPRHPRRTRNLHCLRLTTVPASPFC